MILVAYFAVISAATAPVARGASPGAARDAVRVVLLLSPWVIAGLVAAFDRPGPARSWAVVCLVFLFYPALAIDVDLSMLLRAWKSGAFPWSWGALVFNLLVGGSTYLFYRAMAVTRCPGCGGSALIPLLHISGQSRRLNRTRWCAACGDLYWRDREGVLQEERRTTWADRPQPDAPPDLELEPVPQSVPEPAVCGAVLRTYAPEPPPPNTPEPARQTAGHLPAYNPTGQGRNVPAAADGWRGRRRRAPRPIPGR
jgi:hypothetical protein